MAQQVRCVGNQRPEQPERYEKDEGILQRIVRVEGSLSWGCCQRQGITGSICVKKHQVQANDPCNQERQQVVQAEEARKGRVIDGEPTSDSVRDILPNERDSSN